MTVLALDRDVIAKMWPHGDQHVPGLIEGIAASSQAVLEKYGVTSPLALALMLGQFSEECGGGLEMVENDNFTAEQLLRLFPRHFTGTMAARYAHNPRMICDVAYGGRMGNAPPPSDDGWNYRGKGLSQLTGKENYLKLAEITELDVVADPNLLIEPTTCFECAVADFVKICNCLEPAAKGDVVTTTERLNGGTNGLAARIAWTRLWRRELVSV